MTRDDFTYEANRDGYMVFYKGEPIGGAGVRLPRERPLHWKHAKANVKMFGEQAQDSISALLAGNGDRYMREQIAKIEAQTQFNELGKQRLHL